MTEIVIKVKNSIALSSKTGILTTGMAGVQVSFEFDKPWNCLTKHIEFKVGNDSFSDRLPATNSYTVPPDILKQEDEMLYIGVQGIDASGEIVIPTVYALVGNIEKGSDPFDFLLRPASNPIYLKIVNAIKMLAEKICDVSKRLLGFEDDLKETQENLELIKGCQTAPTFWIAATEGEGGYVVDKTYEEIMAAYGNGRAVACSVFVSDEELLSVPLTKYSNSEFVFSATLDASEWKITIRDDDGTAAADVAVSPYVLVSDLDAEKTTNEKYFGITDDGLIYLQPEYRGEGSADYEYSISYDGVGNNGSKIEELPETIIIPEIVNEIAVTALADGMFCKNKRVKSITIPACITEIPEYFCYSAQGLIEVNGTENVQVMKSRAFSNTALKKVSFPALELLDGDWHFNACGLLVSADLGNKITAISAQCFDGCYRLSALRNAQNVTSVGARAFYRATRLLPPAFLPKLKNIGDYGFMRCRVVYDWASLHENECTFGTKATTLQINPTDFWSECTPVPCEIPMRSTFTQRNPAWSNETVDNTGTKYKNGCITVCSAMVYSVLEEKEMASPQEFMDAVRAEKPALLSLNSQTIPNQIEYWDALGYDGTQKTFDAENLQLLYDTLAAGTPVIVDVLQPSGGHMVVVHGINEKGEVLVVDPESTAYYYGDYRPMTYSITIQNLTDWGFSYFFVTKR